MLTKTKNIIQPFHLFSRMNILRNILIGSRSSLMDHQRRTLKKEIRNKVKEKQSSKYLALEYFDFFYGATFGAEWNKMRLAMLTGTKHAALVNNYSNVDQTIKKLENQASIDMFEFALKHELNKGNELSNEQIEHLKLLKIPPALKIYCFENGETNKFEAPEMDSSNLLDYYCLDASSVLPVLVMDIQKDDVILDLCASPGGKTLVMLQTMLPRKIACRDINNGRIERLKRMLRSYIKQDKLDTLVEIDFNSIGFGPDERTDIYDKVLVDVPCTNDKKSLKDDDNNIFSRKRIDERTELPGVQATLLKQGIDSCKINGHIVYSTCSLSPMQNEGVVMNVLQTYESNKEFRLEVQSLEYLKTNLNYFMTFSNTCKHGLLVTPEINKNYGPFYLCKISKLPK